MYGRSMRDRERGQGKGRAPENHGHEAQGAEGGTGGKQGIWVAPAEGGGREGPDRTCGWP